MAPVAASGPSVLAAGNLDGTATSWLEANWMFFSWAFALFGFGALAARFHSHGPHWFGWLAVAMYCLHQSEEHAYDVRGWRYAFVPAMNQGIGSTLFGAACNGGDVNCPLDPKLTLWVNTVAIWGGFGGCMIAATIDADRFLFASTLNWGTAVVNGFGGHLLQVVLSGSYNPGSVQSAVMVPLGLYIIFHSQRPKLCLVYGLVFHILAFGVGINLVLRAGFPETPTTIAMNLLASLVLPLAISALYARHPPSHYSDMKLVKKVSKQWKEDLTVLG